LREAWAILCRHPLGPEVAEDTVHASVADGSCRPQLYQLVQADDLEGVRRSAAF
jgi:hypothetical protein